MSVASEAIADASREQPVAPREIAANKLVDAVRLSQLMERWDYFAALPVGPHLHIDVTQLSPTDAASRIIEHYGVPSPLEQGVS